MTDRLVVDLGADGAVRVATVLDSGDLPSFEEAATLAWPLDDDALEDLRWYLEDYLIAPYGVYEDRGARIAGALDVWGRTVFKAVFGSGPARDAYVRMRTRGEMELVFRSDAPSLLGLPWELMADPEHDTPLALDIAGVNRSLLKPLGSTETVPVARGQLRVLMVISRPAGTGDVGYRMVARPLLERLEAVRGRVDLVVLRPPTLNALREELKRAAAAGTPYQIVHFDGHGVMPGRSAGPSSPDRFGSPGDEGVLVFEKPGGGADQVPASVIAQVLKDTRVPVVVLNACQSGAVGKELEAAVATRLLREGVASVVAMAYSVYAVAAAEFMAAFYELLFGGGTVSSAVSAGRKQMIRDSQRPSPKGKLPLKDWLVPVHYFRRDVSFPQAVVDRPADLPTLADALAELSAEAAQTGSGDLDAVDGVFVGRDALFYDLEAAARLQKVVVLVGPGGTGKTELAKAFGRWWRDTGGVERPEWVFWHSFEPGVATFGLDGVIFEIGMTLYGTQFGLLESEQRRAVVLKALTEHRMLLLWDNFESVREMPDPSRATPPLDEAGCAEIREFLAALAMHGKSSVLITSRTTEDWLADVRRIKVGGLSRSEAIEYADVLLAPYPAARQRRAGRAFGDLMAWLDGHPLSMRLVLPRLADMAPEALLAGLQGTVPLTGDDTGQGRTGSLAASIAYSYTHLSDQARRLLPAVSLFHGMADANVLGLFSEDAGVPERFAGATKDDWTAALDDAARVSLLTSLGGGMYRVHPALPGYLAAAWRDEDAGDHEAVRDAAIRALLTAHAVLGNWLDLQIESGATGYAYAVIGLERHTLGSLLDYALCHQLWEEAQDIAQPLNGYWTVRGMDVEGDAWADQVRVATETPDGNPPRLDTPAGSLWLFFASAQAARELTRGHIEMAERKYLKIMDALQVVMDSWPDAKRHIGLTFDHLGSVAVARGRLDEAEDWFRKSLAIIEEAGDRSGLAVAYHQLGRVAAEHDRPGEAEEWLRRALAIAEETRNQEVMNTSCHSLGIIALRGSRLDEAEAWFRKSLARNEEAGDRSGLAITYHQLGRVALSRHRPDEAEEWFRMALTIMEEIGNRQFMLPTYHQLGAVALLRTRLSEAEEWSRKALAISEGLGDPLGMALSYAQLGIVAEEQGQLPEALVLMISCVTIFADFPDPRTQFAPEKLAGLTELLGMPALEETWSRVTGHELPRAVREYVTEKLKEGQ